MAVRRLLVYLVVLVTACAASWVVATRMESPQQAAARAEPPAPVPVTARLARGFLHPPVSMTVEARFERSQSVTGPSALAGIVTAVDVAPGAVLDGGTSPLRVNGRPLFVLAGSFALYRDLARGDTGDDVAALQAGLESAGFTTGRDRSGVFGLGTLAAVRRMYSAADQALPVRDAAAAHDDASGVGAPAAGAPAEVVPGPAPAPVPYVPRSEILMVGGLPAVVQSVTSLGTELTGDVELVRLGSGAVVLVAEFPRSSLGALVVGATGTFRADDGSVAEADLTRTDPSEDGQDVSVQLSSPSPVTPGSSYVVAFGNPAAESGERVLAPSAAVVSRGGRSYLYVHRDGGFTEVEVTVEDAVGGTAAVLPVDPATELPPGAEVRVGDDG